MQDNLRVCKSSPAKLQWAKNHYLMHREQLSQRNNERRKSKRQRMIADGLLPDRPKGRPKKPFEEKIKDLAKAEGIEVVVILCKPSLSSQEDHVGFLGRV